MSRNIMNIAKWLPIEHDENKQLFVACTHLKRDVDILVLQLARYLNLVKLQKHAVSSQTSVSIQLDKLELIVDELQNIVNKFKHMLFKIEIQPFIQMIKMKQTLTILWHVKLHLIYLLQQLIIEILFFYEREGEKLLQLIFKISQIINELLALDSKYNLCKKAVLLSKNNCPALQYPMRKMSITRMLQVLAQHRAEKCCHRLIDCLLENYKPCDGGGGNGEDNNSDNSSIEIYRALTRHMTPPIDNSTQLKLENKTTIQDEDDNISITSDNNEEENLQALEILINTEERLVQTLLNVAKLIVPKMLGAEGVKKSKTTGELRISQKVSTKVMEFYEQILWGEVGNYLEHVVLWWGSSPLAARAPHSSQHLREWILQFTPTAPIPQVIIAALHSLADALGCHVTSTSWDQYFRLALVQSYKTNNSDTGKLFSEMLHDLVTLNNQCEVTNEWIVGAPLEELPLVEQIPVLHRLDHSIHTTRLWAASETRKLANCWNVDSFFAIIQQDIMSCLSQLNDLRMDDHTAEIKKGGLGVHVQVCANMREKLVSEVKVNVSKLKEIPQQCLDVLAKICRTVCLANLQMIFPTDKQWRKISTEVPKTPNSYVAIYLDRVLLPVLEATNDHVTSNMILRIMCEAWLDHIYINKIKFSQYGAMQLLTDFASVGNWLLNCAIITQDVRKHMLRNEVLRRCEGVGRLLLRSPGERINMDKNGKKGAQQQQQEQQRDDRDDHEDQQTDESEETETMPAEMYVPNQEQWLELRHVRKKPLLLPSLCCAIDS